MERKEPSNGKAVWAEYTKPTLKNLPDKFKDEDSTSLLRRLELTGSTQVVSEIQYKLAEKKYTRDGYSVQEVAHTIKLPVEVINNWVVLFDWDEIRDKVQFNKFRKFVTAEKKLGSSIDARADKMYGTIEQTVSRMLNANTKAMDDGAGPILEASDLQRLAKTVETTNGNRRSIRGLSKPTQKVQHEISGKLDVKSEIAILHDLVPALSQIIGQDSQLENAKQRKLLSNEKIEDAEYEVINND